MVGGVVGGGFLLGLRGEEAGAAGARAGGPGSRRDVVGGLDEGVDGAAEQFQSRHGLQGEDVDWLVGQGSLVVGVGWLDANVCRGVRRGGLRCAVRDIP